MAQGPSLAGSRPGHVRVKRGRTTAFVVIDVEGGAMAGELRAKTAHMLRVPMEGLRLCCMSGKDGAKLPDGPRVLEDGVALREQGVVVDGVVCAVFKADADQWEQPSFVEIP